MGNSPADELEKIMDQYAITWPQILSDGTGDIIKKYRINSYPTTLLVDPDGVIIARDLRGRQLEDKIDELMAQ